MSDRPAIVQATYANWKPVPSRKVLQLVFEVPIERQGDVLGILGAPGIDTADWYAIAKMAVTKVGTHGADNHPAVKSESANASIPEIAPEGLREKTPFRSLKRSSQAALKIKDDAEFRAWLQSRLPAGDAVASIAETPEGKADRLLKETLGITSKTELDGNQAKAQAWDKLLASFDYRDRLP